MGDWLGTLRGEVLGPERPNCKNKASNLSIPMGRACRKLGGLEVRRLGGQEFETAWY